MPISFFRTFVFALLLLAAPSALALSVPRGFRTVDDAPGVTLYRQRRNYVQVVSFTEGARLRILHGKFFEEGLHGSFVRKPIQEWWNTFAAQSSGAFSLMNGQFFDTTDPDQTPLAFSLKADGKVYEGYGDAAEYPGKKRVLALYPGRAVIEPYDDNPVSLVESSAADMLVGLEPTAAKTLARSVPRTFIGVARTGELVLFSSSMATQASASRTLRAFGVASHQMLMLDGGHSSHLVQNGKVFVPTSVRGDPLAAREKIPQVLGVEAGVR